MLAIRLCLTDNVYYRKLKKDADHHKLLAHTISKSFAAAISESEQLREFARMAHQSAQVSQAQAQASQQQSRHYQAEMHRLQKELDQSLQLTTKLQASINEQPKQHPEDPELAAAKRKAREVHHTCQQQEMDARSLQQRHAETQTEASKASALDRQPAASQQKATESTCPQENKQAVHSGVNLHRRIAPLQLELEAVRSELFAMQQAAQHNQNNQHALSPVQCMLQQTDASIQSVANLHQDMRQTMLGLQQLAKYVTQQPRGNSEIDGNDLGSAVHKRQLQNGCEPCGKRQKVQADAAA